MGTCSCPMPIPVRTANGEPLVWRCSNCNRPLPTPDPRDAEIARLKAEVETAKAWQGAAVLRNHDTAHILIEEIGAPGPENVDETARRAVAIIRAHKRALAAGPAALRADRDWIFTEAAAEIVEAAQAAAMKDDKKGGG